MQRMFNKNILTIFFRSRTSQAEGKKCVLMRTFPQQNLRFYVICETRFFWCQACSSKSRNCLINAEAFFPHQTKRFQLQAFCGTQKIPKSVLKIWRVICNKNIHTIIIS